MDKFIPAKQSSYPFHVAICGNKREVVRTNPIAAHLDAERLGPGAKVVRLLGHEARRLIEMDRLWFGVAA